LFFIFIPVGLALLYFLKAPQPIGVFVSKHNTNTIDSLAITTNGSYKRLIYDEESKKLLFSNKGNWEYENSRLIFYDFFPNDDQKLKRDYDFNSVLITFSVPLEKSFGREVFDYNEVTAKYRFYKLYW
tara:strand:+ start:126 stop:509 length:384 start_codon:yes stop_codon:yes gene_type:complete